mmetsp:Transcript_27426/g.41476  ORF Transcript_27426/g.41476 Transcript_27426/m.41476 type:complete len:95 (-) Transcript_27426:503-787(-)
MGTTCQNRPGLASEFQDAMTQVKMITSFVDEELCPEQQCRPSIRAHEELHAPWPASGVVAKLFISFHNPSTSSSRVALPPSATRSMGFPSTCEG